MVWVLQRLSTCSFTFSSTTIGSASSRGVVESWRDAASFVRGASHWLRGAVGDNDESVVM